MSTVGHYLERWLELSAGFVAEHVKNSRHRGVVISREDWVCLDAFPYEPRHSLHALRDRTPERWKAFATTAELRTLLKARRVDLVHVHFGYAAADVIGATRGKRPFVLSLHGHDVTGLLRDNPNRYTPVAAAVDAVIVPSQFLASAAEKAGFARDAIRIIPSGIDTGFFTPSPLPTGPPIIGFVGRFVEKKGIDTLMSAWPTIAAAVPQARLQLLGDGPLRHLLPVDDGRITHLTPQPERRHEQVRDLLRASTVVVTPSHEGSDGDSESLLLVNLEAGASGRPVVSTRHGGIPEYVANEHTGLLVEPADATAFADAVVRLLRDHALAQALGMIAPAYVDQWDVRKCTARVDDLYDELLRRGRK